MAERVRETRGLSVQIAVTGRSRCGAVRRGRAGQVSARRGEGLEWQGQARQGPARHGWAMRGKARQGFFSEDNAMRYEFELIGVSSLLVHADNVLAADDLMRWRKDPANKSVSTPGDDRSPAWTWMTYLYSDNDHLCMLADAIMVSLRFAGAKMIMKKQETFRAATQSGILIDQEHLPILTPTSPISVADITKLKNLPFDEQSAAVEKLGFRLDVRRAVVGTSKHVRVRPRFDQWALKGTLEVNEPAITPEVLSQLFEIAGQRSGIGDWRPSAKKSGPFGRFATGLRRLD